MDHKEFFTRAQLHADHHPHWSLSVKWRKDRWDHLSFAPVRGYPIQHIKGRTKDGEIIKDMHYACGDGDGLMPPFDGWFAPYPDRESGFYQVFPVEWQPLTVSEE